MKVGLNATCLNDRPSGARQRFVGIYRALVERLPDTEFLVYEPRDCRVADWFAGAANVTARRTQLPSEGRLSRLVKGVGYWRRTLGEDGLQLFEGFHLPLVTAPTGRTLLTVHDLRGLYPPSRRAERALFAGVLWHSLARADHVITVSHAMRKELEAFFPKARVSVLYNGIDVEAFRATPDGTEAMVRAELDLPGPFLLSVGHFEPRKNYLTLLDAVARLKVRGEAIRLVIVGNDSGTRRDVEERAAALGLSEQVRLLSGLRDETLRALYRLATLFVFPSSYEGFGIPVLEAMAAGCPMVLSDLPVFRELTQDQGRYFPAADPEALASAISHALGSSSDRQRLVDYGLRRIQDFRFENLAGQLAELYRALV